MKSLERFKNIIFLNPLREPKLIYYFIYFILISTLVRHNAGILVWTMAALYT